MLTSCPRHGHVSSTTTRQHRPAHHVSCIPVRRGGLTPDTVRADAQASACCKHYAANSMDGTTQNGIHHDRNHYNAVITKQDLVDSYMLPFQACVEKGKVG